MVVLVADRELDLGMKIVALFGRIDMEAAEADYPVVQQAIDDSPAGIVVDLKEVDFVSSAGFRMLLMAYKEAQRVGKVMLLTRPRPSVYKIFKVVALDQVLPFCDEIEVDATPIQAS
jgi:anti-anti-sigma factor